MKTMTTVTVVALAEKHLGAGAMVSSARLCIDDARVLARRGDDIGATRRALRSLAYSVGILHADYRAVLEMSSALRSAKRAPEFNTYEA